MRSIKTVKRAVLAVRIVSGNVAKLIYAAITSLDGYVADDEGKFDWSRPSDEVHEFVNDLERPIGAYLYGRRMYEVMKFWETAPTAPDASSPENDYAEIWRSANKIVFSRTLGSGDTAKTEIKREFDPAEITKLKLESSTDISVGGPMLAAQALAAGLVDECYLFVSPVLVGGGNPAFHDKIRSQLELLGERRFANGVVALHYAVL